MSKAPTIFPESTDPIHESSAEMSAISQLDFRRNPNCSGGNSSFLSQNSYSWLAAILWQARASTGRTEIGLKFVGSVLLPFPFHTGQMFACFHSDGKKLELKLAFRIVVIAGAIAKASFFTRNPGIPSGRIITMHSLTQRLNTGS
jgi:hypothetical protein